MKTFWNERYAEVEYAYGEAPNAFFKEYLQNRPVGKLLLPAEGEGRNAVYAAQLGWTVSAFDFSESGQQKARTLAAKKSVTIDYQVTDVANYTVQPASFDLVGLFYAHMPPPLRQILHQKAIESLRPGGVLVLEAFQPAQIDNNTGGPKRPALLYDKNTLVQDFASLQIQMLTTLDTELREGPYHHGLASVIRCIATKPSTDIKQQ